MVWPCFCWPLALVRFGREFGYCARVDPPRRISVSTPPRSATAAIRVAGRSTRAVHPPLFRHARVRQIVRSTRNLPLAQRQAGWSRLQPAYLTIGEKEARQLMQDVPE